MPKTACQACLRSVKRFWLAYDNLGSDTFAQFSEILGFLHGLIIFINFCFLFFVVHVLILYYETLLSSQDASWTG